MRHGTLLGFAQSRRILIVGKQEPSPPLSVEVMSFIGKMSPFMPTTLSAGRSESTQWVLGWLWLILFCVSGLQPAWSLSVSSAGSHCHTAIVHNVDHHESDEPTAWSDHAMTSDYDECPHSECAVSCPMTGDCDGNHFLISTPSRCRFVPALTTYPFPVPVAVHSVSTILRPPRLT